MNDMTDNTYNNPPYAATEELKQILISDNISPSNCLNFLHVNIRSLIKNIDRLHQLICNLPIEPDIIFVTETKLNCKSNIKFTNINNYTFIHKNSLSCAGGVGIYLKNQLEFTIRQDIELHNIDTESLWIKIFITKSQSITVGVIYNHPNSKISNFLNLFREILIKINNENHNCYITGDFNINTLEKSTKNSINNYSLMIKSVNFHNIIKTPTRITKTSATCIDHLYTNNKTSIIKKFILIDNISDHFPLLGIINLKLKHKHQEQIWSRNFSKINSEQLQFDTQMKMQQLLNQFLANPTESIHTEFKLLTDAIKEIVNNNLPLIKLSKKKSRLKQKPWLTKALLISAKNKNKMYKKLIKTKFNSSQFLLKYKKFRNKLNHLITISKKMHYEKLLINSKNDSKKTWNIINSVIGKDKKKTNLPKKLKTKYKTYTEPHKIAHELNKYFTEIGKNNQDKVDFNKINKYIQHNIKDSLVLYGTTPEEISTIIKQLKNKNSEGPDNIPVCVIKKINTNICQTICYLINKSISTGIYPNCLKNAKVIPLFKSGDPSDPGNYRLISLLSIINKIYEIILFRRLLNFFEKNNIINNNQFGFRKGHSTELAISKFYEDILTNFNNNHGSFALFLDLSKAFDSVNRKILMNKLYKYGIRGVPYNLFNSYLNNRTQYLEANNIKSEPWPTTVGVPQGSVISPLLFLIHINDFENCTNMKVINFADDTLLYCGVDNLSGIQESIDNELKNIINWMQINHLKLNLTKTNYMIFSPKSNKFKSLHKLKLFENFDTQITQKSHCKYLGLIIDCNLDWKMHILNLQTKLSKAVGTLYRVRNILNKSSLIKIIYALIISNLKYGILSYARANKTSLKPLNVLFNQALRTINFLKRTDKNNKQLYLDENILTLEQMFKLELGKFCFKFHQNVLPYSFNNYFTAISDIHRYNTRNFKNRFYIHKQLKQTGLKTLSFMGAKFWNTIPNKLKKQKSIYAFSKHLKKHLLKLT